MPAVPGVLEAVEVVVTVGNRMQHGLLGCWPLHTSRSCGSVKLPLRSLGQALEDGFVSIDAEDADDCGRWVRIANRGSESVVVLGGDELAAAGPGLVADTSTWLGAFAETSVHAVRVAPARREAVELSRSFRPQAEQVGFVAAIDDRILGLECAATCELFSEMFELLLLPYAIEAIEAAERSGVEPLNEAISSGLFRTPEEFMAALRHAGRRSGSPAPTPGSLHFDSAAVEGSALFAGAEMIHLTAMALG